MVKIYVNEGKAEIESKGARIECMAELTMAVSKALKGMGLSHLPFCGAFVCTLLDSLGYEDVAQKVSEVISK